MMYIGHSSHVIVSIYIYIYIMGKLNNFNLIIDIDRDINNY